MSDRERNLIDRVATMLEMSGMRPQKDSLNPIHAWLYDARSLLEAAPQSDTVEPVAWVSPLRYGSQVTFPKPVKPDGWDDSDLDVDWYCYPLYRHPPAKTDTVAVDWEPMEAECINPAEIIAWAESIKRHEGTDLQARNSTLRLADAILDRDQTADHFGRDTVAVPRKMLATWAALADSLYKPVAVQLASDIRALLEKPQ